MCYPGTLPQMTTMSNSTVANSFCICRGMAYEAVGIFASMLESQDFRENLAVTALLAFLRNAVQRPFQKLPAVCTLFAAEAAAQLMQPGSAVYPAISKLLIKRPAMNLEVRGELHHADETFCSCCKATSAMQLCLLWVPGAALT